MKAIFVDGPSTHHMGHAMNIARLNLFELHQLLTQEVGYSKELAAQPFATIRPSIGKNAVKPYRTAGFNALEVNGANGSDDQAIITRIQGLDPQKVSEVVIVSADQDYVPVLREKAQQGIKVFWVGCSAKGAIGTPLMSPDLKTLFDSTFTFIDIMEHRERLTGKAKPVKTTPAVPKVPVRDLKIELSGARSQDEYLTILALIARQLRKSPHIKYKIEG